MLARVSTQSRWRQVALVAAIVGAGVSAYLLVEYLGNSGGICLTGTGCDEVRLSQFAYPLGIPMPLYGLAFYLVTASVAWRSHDPSPIAGVAPRVILATLGLVGVAVAAVLTGLEAFVIRAYCTWCLLQAGAALLLAVSAVRLLRPAAELPAASRPGRPHASHRAQRAAARARETDRAGLFRTAALASSGMAVLVIVLLVAGAAASAPTPTPSSSGSADLVPSWAPQTGSGAVTVVEFADYECPACGVVAPILRQLADEGSITLVFRNFPLSQHPNAVPAARAARAALAQGKFWEMHEQLFATQSQWSSLSTSDAQAYFEGLASQLGLDLAAFRTAYAASTTLQPINDDLSAAMTLDLPGTPSIYIDGTVYQGQLSLAAIRAAVQARAGG
jgi:protein-disulfide isomerase